MEVGLWGGGGGGGNIDFNYTVKVLSSSWNRAQIFVGQLGHYVFINKNESFQKIFRTRVMISDKKETDVAIVE